MPERLCPNCGSDHVRRGGNLIWGIYVGLILLAVPAVLFAHLHAGLVAGAMLAGIAITHLVVAEWVCADCAHQWRER